MIKTETRNSSMTFAWYTCIICQKISALSSVKIGKYYCPTTT